MIEVPMLVVLIAAVVSILRWAFIVWRDWGEDIHS